MGLVLLAIPKNLRKLYEKYQADESNVLFCGMSGLEPWLPKTMARTMARTTMARTVARIMARTTMARPAG